MFPVPYQIPFQTRASLLLPIKTQSPISPTASVHTLDLMFLSFKMVPVSGLSLVIAALCVSLAFSTSIPTKHTKRAELGFGRTGKPLPDLFSATLEELQGGLAIGSFNSVDLVKVFSSLQWYNNLGIPRSHYGSQSYFECLDRNESRSIEHGCNIGYGTCKRKHRWSVTWHPHDRQRQHRYCNDELIFHEHDRRKLCSPWYRTSN
jgi:hypothetical protein